MPLYQWRPKPGSAQDDRQHDQENNVMHRQIDQRNSNYSKRHHSKADNREFYGRRQGRAEGNNSGWFNPKVQQFNPHTEITPVN